MADRPDAYDKNPHPPPGRLRFWLGFGLLLATLAAVGYLLYALQPDPQVQVPPREPLHSR